MRMKMKKIKYSLLYNGKPYDLIKCHQKTIKSQRFFFRFYRSNPINRSSILLLDCENR